MKSFFSQINWHVLWQPKELLLVQPPILWPLMWAYIAFIALSLIGIIATVVFRKRIHPTLSNRIYSITTTQIVLGALLFFFRFYQIPYLGMDIWRTIQEVTALIWLGFIIVYAQRVLPKQLLKEQAELRRNKYLPGQK